VHLWYAEKFGNVLAPYTSTEDAITTFPTTATAIGVQPRPEDFMSSRLMACRTCWADRATQQEADHASDLRCQGEEVEARWPDLRVVAW
jgi:hypothetical protein